ncbi:hypothetical protein TgHK011_006815 [Trichoderma gracile]|nr:hypothetical protein TgHK011_006815 [Trichoderma gracile]
MSRTSSPCLVPEPVPVRTPKHSVACPLAHQSRQRRRSQSGHNATPSPSPLGVGFDLLPPTVSPESLV